MEVRKILRIFLGFLALAVGLVLALPGVPGPGIAVMIVGLVLLSNHFEWARRALHWARARYESVKDKVTQRSR